ncbi:MAG: hypothetical protein PHG82_02280 [Candidatus Gracilibacteria bacterium]|nr:hypothetical protein [Candidatus Gracilibacteria bacterium]
MPIFTQKDEELGSTLAMIVDEVEKKEITLSKFLEEIKTESLSNEEIEQVLGFITLIHYKFDELGLMYTDPETGMDSIIHHIQEVDSWMTKKQATLYLLFSVRINANCGMDGELSYVRRLLKMEKVLKSVISEDISTIKLQSFLKEEEKETTVEKFPYLYTVAEVRDNYINSPTNLAIEDDITCILSPDYA